MNYRYTNPDLFTTPNYAHSVLTDGKSLLFTSGGVPLDSDGNLVGKDDYVTQTQQVVTNLQTVLIGNKFSIDEIIKTTVYVVTNSKENLEVVWLELEKLGIANKNIASTLLGVTCLGYENQLVEVEVVAAKD